MLHAKTHTLCVAVGYLVMTDDWFTEHVFEVVINKSHLPDKVIEVLERKPIVLPAWDPMGALA